MSNAPEFGQGQGTLTQAASRVAAARQDFAGYSTSMNGRLDALRSAWGGQGATAFFALQQAWTEKQKTIVDALDDFSASLTQTERTNNATDEDRSSAMSNLTSKLG